MPSVAISGGTRKRVMMTPLTKPAKVPTTSPRPIATGSGRPMFFQNTPIRIAVMPRIEPTDRSMPPVMMTKVMMIAISPTSVISRPWLNRLSSGEEPVRLPVEHEEREDDEQREDRLVAEELAQRHRWALRNSRLRRAMSTSTVTRIRRPITARSQ